MKTLERHVKAVNETNKLAYDHACLITPQLIPFVGKKVVTINKTLVKKLSDSLQIAHIQPEALEGDLVTVQHVHVEIGYKELYAKVSLCFTGGIVGTRTRYCDYVRRGFKIAELEDDRQTLKEVRAIHADDYPFMLDYEDEKKKIEIFVKLQEQANEAYGEIKAERSTYINLIHSRF